MKELDPKETARAEAFALWMHAPMPMVTLCKTLNVTNLVKLSRRRGLKFNMLMCWCTIRAASQMEDFYLLPVGEKLVQYDALAVSTVVKTGEKSINTCDIPCSDSLTQFNEDYLHLTKQVRKSARPHDLSETHMVIGTSALAQYEIDSAVNLYAGCYNNPFLIWGKYRKSPFRALLPISFQFHHTQLDGLPAADFLERLQNEISGLRFKR